MLEQITYTNIVIFCVGISSLPGDSIGPIVGDLLNKKIKNDKIKIYGRV